MGIIRQSVGSIFKMITTQDYAITALAAVGTIPLIGYVKYFDLLMENTELKNIVLPIVIEIIGIIMFFIFSLIHLMTGLQASKHEYKEQNKLKVVKVDDWFDKDKIWNMYWKTLGVTFFTTLIMFITILSEIIGNKYIHISMIWLQTTLLFLACGFEFQSIGNNLTRMGKEKYDIFKLVDKIIGIVQDKLTSKLTNSKEINKENEQ